MRRRQFFLGLAALLATPRALAQSLAEKPKRIGLLVQGSRASRGHLDQALIDALREQGYVEGRNLVIERRYADGGGNPRLREFAQELEALKLDAVVTTCTPSTQAMKGQSSTTPIVMAVVADPVGQGLIASLAKPGSNREQGWIFRNLWGQPALRSHPLQRAGMSCPTRGNVHPG